MAVARIVGFVLLCIGCCAASAQAVGDSATNKQFLQSWNIAVGIDETADYQPTQILLLDWFGVS